MSFLNIWTFLTFVIGVFASSDGYGLNTPNSNNDVYFWAQKTNPVNHRSSVVAKYSEPKFVSSAENSSRRLFGRHVCTQNKMRMIPVKDMQTYCKPAYHSYLRRCDKDNSRYCSGYRVVYELAYRTVQRLIAQVESTPTCCPGWTQVKVSSTDCKKAICKEECRNGGTCTKPDYCSCQPGWTGKNCETDVNECSKGKDDFCEHDCVNTPGSYRCDCRPGHTLLADGRSCTKIIDTNQKIEIDEKLSKKIDALQKRLDALEAWQERLKHSSSNGEEARHQRDDRINSLSEQIAILEEKLADYKKEKRRHSKNLQTDG